MTATQASRRTALPKFSRWHGTLIVALDAFSSVESSVWLLDLHQLRVDLPHTRQRSFTEWLGPWYALHGTDIAATRNGIA